MVRGMPLPLGLAALSMKGTSAARDLLNAGLLPYTSRRWTGPRRGAPSPLHPLVPLWFRLRAPASTPPILLIARLSTSPDVRPRTALRRRQGGAMIPSRAPEVHVRTRRQLARAGHRRREIETLVERGVVERLGGGFYGTVQTPPHVRAALRRGHRLTCVDALELYGFWIPRQSGAHEARRRVGPSAGESAACRGSGVVLHTSALRTWPDEHPVLPKLTALEHAMHCLGADHAAVVLESGLNRRLISSDEANEVTRSLSARRRRRLFPLVRAAESGTETLVRRALQRRGVSVRVQVEIPGVGRVDLVVGEGLIIECDSATHHSDPEAYAKDRRRDRVARRRGYTVVRLTYEDVMVSWEEVLPDLLVMLRRGDHRIARSQRSARLDGDGLLRDPRDEAGALRSR
ncbi:DUF559 domain-containing protein [Brachybacterium saurashtrense]|uniref:DUF559 domain-containing protein n=2 Tax=Brachybacterium saurashtrense TaxID=556288 RepID=A0A345YRD0_9MICO|nr:DUF559 domain-containing protein [Brachybacterium saurashtrense]RRR24223.1 DUF559 domain-containing protein [Brachybacterium saurashtrense]